MISMCQNATVYVLLAVISASTIYCGQTSTDRTALTWSTFLGGSMSDEASDVVVDEVGNIYVTGWTESDDFPTTPGAFDVTHNGGSDVFVLKLDPDGGLIYSTLLGGGDGDQAFGIDVDGEGSAYLTGRTMSADFPARDALDTTYGGNHDAFVAKLDSTGGNLIYATYLGGADYDRGKSIAVDQSGCAYLTGWTRSANFPVTGQAFCSIYHDYREEDAFVAKVSPDGLALIYATYLGGKQEDWGQDIAIDTAGNAYVAVLTYSPGLPTTNNAFDRTYNGSRDAYVVKMNSSGSELLYATFLGGSAQDWPQGLVVDGSGHVHVVGVTFSTDFPTTKGAIDTAHNGYSDVFVATLSMGSALLYSTFLGGADEERSSAVALDGDGNLYLTGWTKSADFPITPLAPDSIYHGQADAFVVMLNPMKNQLVYASFLGGRECDIGYGLDVSDDGQLYLVGTTRSPDFPTTPGILFSKPRGEDDAFVSKIDLSIIDHSHP